MHGAGGKPDLDFGAAEVCEFRNTDESLAEIRQSLKDGHPEFVEKDSLIYRVQGQPGKEEVWERRKHAVGPSHEMPRNSTEAGSRNYNSRTPGEKENYPVVAAAVLRGS